MQNINPAQAAANWKTNYAAAGTKLKNGVQAVTTAPTQAAANAIDRMVAGFQAAAASGKIQSGLQSVSLADWQAAMINKTIPRMATGASEGVNKVQNFMNQFLPFEQTVVASLPPRGDIEQNIQRAAALMRANAGFNYRKTVT